MLHSRLYRSFFIALLVLLTGSLWAISSARFSGNAPTGEITLKAPPFASVAKAEANQPATFADDEAGIAAYINVGQSIDLSKVDDLCRAIEEVNVNYLLCSIGVPDYDENHDPKLFVHKDGWVMAYYRNSEPTSKVFDWRHYTGNTTLPTKLEQALNLVITKIGAASVTPTYYHFAYPNANKMMLIGEITLGKTQDSFQLTLPQESQGFSYYERSWSLGDYTTLVGNVTLQLDGQEISTINYDNRTTGNDWAYNQGKLSASQLTSEQLHTINVDNQKGWNSSEKGFAGIALIYGAP